MRQPRGPASYVARTFPATTWKRDEEEAVISAPLETRRNKGGRDIDDPPPLRRAGDREGLISFRFGNLIVVFGLGRNYGVVKADFMPYKICKTGYRSFVFLFV